MLHWHCLVLLLVITSRLHNCRLLLSHVFLLLLLLLLLLLVEEFL
jgi:hypothetical protein